MTAYAEFLARKRVGSLNGGIDIDALPSSLFHHQEQVVRWAGRVGRAAAFLDTGLGKTRIQLAWAEAMRGDRSALIVCPLSIAAQTRREAAALGIEARVVRSGDQVTGPGLWITNYEMQHAFEPSMFGAVVLDESSILKNHEGRTRGALIDRWGKVPYRLACTATPAPNDHTELANHAEFLGAMSRVEMLAAFFVHDDDGWRLKGHAADAMYEWMCQWAVAARRPSDVTGDPSDDDGYELPPLRVHGHIVEANAAPEGQLFATSLGGVGGRAAARKATLGKRVQRAAELLDHDRPAIAWCGLNDEAEAMAREVDGAENLHGTLTPDRKVEIIEAFVAGEIRVLVSKPSIAGFGLNLQHAAEQVFVGLGDSYEAYYQAIRRSWRFGQTRPVDVHVVVSDLESEVPANVLAKERSASEMTDRLVRSTQLARKVPA
ncbi:MAG: helicase [Planctomycetes bacterium]|nr:helicase [Planctomycetota bacterium]